MAGICAERRNELRPGQPRHVEIEDDRARRRAGPNPVQRVLSVDGLRCGDPGVTKVLRQTDAHVGVVIDDQHLSTPERVL